MLFQIQGFQGSKILGRFGQIQIQIQILDLFKLSKQSSWILITQIQIHVPKSCHPNAPSEKAVLA